MVSWYHANDTEWLQDKERDVPRRRGIRNEITGHLKSMNLSTTIHFEFGICSAEYEGKLVDIDIFLMKFMELLDKVREI